MRLIILALLSVLNFPAWPCSDALREPSIFTELEIFFQENWKEPHDSTQELGVVEVYISEKGKVTKGKSRFNTN